MITLGIVFILVALVNGQDEDIPCSLDDGRDGICVQHYLCNNGIINTDGSGGLLDVRFEGECPSLNLCCGSKDVTNKSEPYVSKDVALAECGVRNPNGVKVKINNAKYNDAQIAEFPWMVAILREEILDEDLEDLKGYVYKCGGGLISANVVVSSVHNLLQDNKLMSDLLVRAGEWDTRITIEPHPHQNVKVKTVILHDKFNSRTLVNDISLLIMEKPFKLNEAINPICLPNGLPYVGYDNCVVTGWGKETFSKTDSLRNILKKVNLPFVRNSDCEVALQKTRLTARFHLADSFVCAGGIAGEDACIGDGGSPLACPIPGKPGRYYFAGIVSWGIGCGTAGVPGVYTNVFKYREWINSQLKLHNIVI